MTLASSIRYALYEPVVSTDTFAVTFPIFASDELEVYVNGTLSSAYSVTLGTFANARYTGSEIVLTTAVSSGTVEIYGKTTVERETDYSGSTPNLARNIQNDLDRLYAVVQEATRDFTGSLRVPAAEDEVARLPAVATRANKYLYFDSNGAPTVASTLDASEMTVTSLWETVLALSTADASLQGLGLSAATSAALRSGLGDVLTSGGSGGAFTLNPANTMTAYTTGDIYTFVANHSDAAAYTLNVDSLGAKSIKKWTSGVGQETVNNYDFGQYDTVTVRYDGTDFILVNRTPGGTATDARLGLVEAATLAELKASTQYKWPDAQIVGQYVGAVVLDTQDLSNVATADFTAFDNTRFYSYEFILSNVVPASDAVNLLLRTSTDGGSSYAANPTSYRDCAIYVDETGTATDFGSAGSSSIRIARSVGSSTDEDGYSGTVRMYGPHLTKRTRFTFEGASTDESDQLTDYRGSGERLGSEDNDAVRFFFGSGNIESGTITMIGHRKED